MGFAFLVLNQTVIHLSDFLRRATLPFSHRSSIFFLATAFGALKHIAGEITGNLFSY